MNELGNRRRSFIPLSPADIDGMKEEMIRDARTRLTPGTKFTVLVGPWADGSTQVAWYYSAWGHPMPYGPGDEKREQTTFEWHTA